MPSRELSGAQLCVLLSEGQQLAPVFERALSVLGTAEICSLLVEAEMDYDPKATTTEKGFKRTRGGILLW